MQPTQYGMNVRPNDQPQISSVQNVPMFVLPPQFGPQRMQVKCPHCNSMVITQIEQDTSDKAWLFGFLICLLGGLCVFGLCLSCIPCCLNSMQDTKHYCPACKNMIGQYKAWSYDSGLDCQFQRCSQNQCGVSDNGVYPLVWVILLK